MAESIVQDWLTDFQRIQGQPSEVKDFANEHDSDSEIAEAIFTILHDRQRHESLVHDICQQLLAFYRSTEKSLQKFPLQFIPVLIYTYLHAVAGGDKKGVRSLETLLICIYNGEVSTEEGGERVVQFRMPILAQASVYHEEKNLPLTDLRRWEENCNREVKWGPHQRIEAITAQNRLRIMTALLFCYNQQVSLTQKSALIHLCRVSSQLVTEGFNTKSTHAHRISYGSDPSLMPKSMIPRIPLSSAFLVELVHAIYFAMFNGFGTVAIQTLEDIHNRACFEMYTELILITSAVRNSLHANPSGQPSDGPMGLSVALTPSTNTVTTAVSKSMITNASFRTKKLPDDIPIQVQDLTMPQAPQQLASVTEETAEQTQNAKEGKESGQGSRNSIIRPSMEGIKAQAHKALIAGFKKSKGKEKDKDKDAGDATTGAHQTNGNAATNNIDSSTKPPQRKLDKHMQRNSLMQLQMESSSSEFEKSPGPVKGKTYESLDTMEMLPMQSLLANESGSGSFSIDSDLNGGALVTGTNVSSGLGGGGGGVVVGGSVVGGLTNNSNNNSTTTTTSLTSSDLLTTKSFDSSIELPPLSATPGIVGVKTNDTLVD
ncbi:hyccin-like [Lucilia sericata]|uniref:hyccin-like n=1 Tax=Lucilia sericata TaxID=13632 RepID=UPI0018A7EBAA|nr:hyccin-like [Lucilia sericata]